VVDSEGKVVSTPCKINGYLIRNLALGNFDGLISIVATLWDTLSTTFNGQKIVAYDYMRDPVFNVNLNDYNDLICGLVVGDVDSDGESEVIITYRSRWYDQGPSGIQIYNKEGTLEREIEIPALGYADDYCYDYPILSDFDSDGELEIVQQSWFFPSEVGRERKTRIYIINLGTPYNPNKMDWPMFQHDPQHTGCYGCEKIALPPVNNSRPQSKIVNNGDFDVKGILSLRLQKSVMAPDGYERWITHSFCEGEVVIPAHGFIKLDVGEPCAWNLYNVSASEPGRYRVYGKFQVGEEFVDASWEFDVLKSKRKVIKES